MKKVLLLSAMMTALASMAMPVSVDKATTVAQSFWNSTLQAKDAMPLHRVEWQYDKVYLFMSEPCGWVLVSADDVARPVLAYSLTSTFDPRHIPAAMEDMLYVYQQELSHVDALNGAASHAEWEILLKGGALKDGDDAVGPLMTTTWYQTYPYNQLCPGGAMTGCVATAMAQILKFWNFPAFGKGKNSYTDDSGYGMQSADFMHTRYDWDNMPNLLSASSSAAEKSAVATLMYHCGVSVNMHYSTVESGTSGVNVAPALVKHFRCDSTTIRYKSKGNTSNDDWTDTLIQELRHLRPIMYGGSGPMGGHQFVCDGFDARRYLHFNLGENGQGDGFYMIGAINYGSYSFNNTNDAVLGIKPDYSIYVSDEQLDLNRYATTESVWVATNDTMDTPWDATTDAGWISLSNTSFAHLGEMGISVTDNNTGSEREGVVTVTQAGHSATITVKQSAYDPDVDYCPLTVEMENTRNEAWSGGAYLSFESPSGLVYGTASHTANSGSSVTQVMVAPHDVICRWHEGGAFDRYINYRVKNQFGEVLIDVESARFEGRDVLIVWPCVRVDIDDVAQAKCKVFPNPATDRLTVEAEGLLWVELLDESGRMVSSAEGENLDITTLPAGFYVVRIITAGGTYVDKVMKK